MSAYSRGYAFERKVETYLRTNGYHVVQSRGSHGLADLVASKPGQLLLVQCKSGLTGMDHDSWNALLDLAQQNACIPVVADRPRRGVIRLRRITGPHSPRSQAWPCVEFAIDELAAAIARHPAGKKPPTP